MKKNFKIAYVLLAIAGIFAACENNDNSNNRPTAVEMKASHEAALNGITQHFQFPAGSGPVTFTSAHGVTISLDSDDLMYNGGSAVTGIVKLDFIEIFDKGTMAITNKPTRGMMANGDLAMLDSGGQFFINASQNGQDIAIEGLINLDVPVEPNLMNDGMGLWVGVENDTVSAEPVIWQGVNDPALIQGVIFTNGSYFCTFANFGWCNVDMFCGDPRPKTTLLAQVPQGYNDQNSRVYLSYDNFGHSLANLDTYTSDGHFSEHYGQIPIGMECHAIFMTVENGAYRYAIKPVTITAGGMITFAMSETTTGTSDQLVAAINAAQ